jgi:hypothetical protein
MLSNVLHSPLTDDPVPFAPPKWLTIVAAISATLTAFLALFIYLGPIIASLFLLSGIIAFLHWLSHGYAEPVSRRVIPAFVLLIVINLPQAAEQLAGSYAPTIAAMFPSLVTPANAMTDFTFITAFPLVSTSVWLFTGALVFYQVRLGSYLVILLAVWSVIFPISHFVLPLFAADGFAYLPGMFTAPFVIFTAALTLKFIHNNPTRTE